MSVAFGLAPVASRALTSSPYPSTAARCRGRRLLTPSFREPPRKFSMKYISRQVVPSSKSFTGPRNFTQTFRRPAIFCETLHILLGLALHPCSCSCSCSCLEPYSRSYLRVGEGFDEKICGPANSRRNFSQDPVMALLPQHAFRHPEASPLGLGKRQRTALRRLQKRAPRQVAEYGVGSCRASRGKLASQV